MIRLGITGGIGSGKSFVSALLREHFRIPVYDCDTEAKRLTAESEKARQALTELVGDTLYCEGILNKRMLAEYLFKNRENAERVEQIIHPLVRTDFRQWTGAQQSTIVGMESAILYESGFETEVDKVLFVCAQPETRIARAMQRDGTERHLVEERIRSQRTKEMSHRADFLIENEAESTKAELIEKLKEIIYIIENKETC